MGAFCFIFVYMKSGVYLIKCPYEGIEMLKIGFSKDVLKRLKQHKTSNPLIEVIGYIAEKDYKWLEKEIHYKCRKYQYKTEWFYNKPEIITYFTSHENFIQL